MALTWEAKAPEAAIRYSWPVPVADGDTLDSFTSAVSGATIDDEASDGNDVVLYVSGGTAGSTAIFTLLAHTANGEDIPETIYLPILPSNDAVAFGNTAQEIIDFALRPIVGLSGTPTTAERNDGLEWLNGMLARWKSEGADVGAVTPLALATVVYCPDEWLQAIKLNLRVVLAEQYGRQVAPATAIMAARGLQKIKNANLPDDRGAAVFY